MHRKVRFVEAEIGGNSVEGIQIQEGRRQKAESKNQSSRAWAHNRDGVFRLPPAGCRLPAAGLHVSIAIDVSLAAHCMKARFKLVALVLGVVLAFGLVEISLRAMNMGFGNSPMEPDPFLHHVHPTN